MNTTFEQARAILAEDLGIEGDGRQVAAWGWENDEVFVLALEPNTGDTGQDPDDEVLVGDAESSDDDWGTPEDLQAVGEHVRLVPPGWDPWEGRPAEVPVVEKATGQLRWVVPPSLGSPVAASLRPIGDVTE